jgi:sigma54-dependent transcription regulator
VPKVATCIPDILFTKTFAIFVEQFRLLSVHEKQCFFLREEERYIKASVLQTSPEKEEKIQTSPLDPDVDVDDEKQCYINETILLLP